MALLGTDVCYSVLQVCFHWSEHEIMQDLFFFEREILHVSGVVCMRACVSVLDSPRPGAADHLQDRGRLTEEREKQVNTEQNKTPQKHLNDNVVVLTNE